MELRHLKYFIAVAEEQSFSKAAKKLNIAQPPLSYQINILENELKLKLFNRNVRPIELTLAGKYFYQKSLELLTSLHNYCEETLKISTGESGSLKIAFSGNGIFYTIPFIVNKMQLKYPLIKLDLIPLNTHDQIKYLIENFIEIGIICALPTLNEIETKIICEENFLLVLPKSHKLAKINKPIDLHDLKQDKFILTKKDAGEHYYNIIEKIFLDASLKPIVIQEVYDLYTALALVKANLGVTIVPESFKKLSLNGIVFKKISNINEKLFTAIAWRKDSKNPLVKLIIDLF